MKKEREVNEEKSCMGDSWLVEKNLVDLEKFCNHLIVFVCKSFICYCVTKSKQ